MPKERKCAKYFPAFLACGTSPSITSPLTRLVIYSPDNKKKALNCSANYTAPFVSQAKQEIRLLSAQDGIKKTLCFICLKQSHLDDFTRPHVGLCCSSEQIGKQHKRSAGKVPAGCHNMLVCRRTSVAQSPCLIPLRLPLPFFLTLTSLLSLAHFAVCITYFLSFFLSLYPWHWVCQPVGLPVCLLFLFLLGLPHTSSSFSFCFKIRVSWLCAESVSEHF